MVQVKFYSRPVFETQLPYTYDGSLSMPRNDIATPSALADHARALDCLPDVLAVIDGDIAAAFRL